MNYIGLDIGGSKFLVASADAQGNIRQRVQRPTPPALEDGIALLQEMIAIVSDGQPVSAIGAAAGGPLDWQTGVISPLHQPAWRDVPLRQIMADRWGCPLYVDVDTNVAALAEYHLGGHDVPALLYLTISTGMGGGLVQNGRLYRGHNGAHPEVGHQTIRYRCRAPANVRCACGAPDCLEGLISGNAIRRIYGRPAEALDEADWAEVAFNLGQGLRNLATIYAPDLIVLGGGVAVGGGQPFLDAAIATMQAHLNLVPAPAVRLSNLGYDTALMGAITVARLGLNE